jgi:hypothetical protein
MLRQIGKKVYCVEVPEFCPFAGAVADLPGVLYVMGGFQKRWNGIQYRIEKDSL